MAWRFKASKYKNAAPIVPKPETCIRDIVVGSYQTFGNNIAASAAFMAFNWEHTGSSLAVLPLDDCGRKSKTMPLLHAHSDTITDLGFSPFHDGLLATGSQDCLVKVWHIPEKGLETSLSDPECTFSHKQRRVETVGFHPTAECLIHSTSSGVINLWDISVQKEIFASNDHPEVIQSLSWKQDGTIFATSCKDKIVRIVDPRAATSTLQTADSHASIKDSRVVWLGEQNRILTTGFDAARLRQVIIRDIRNINSPEKTLELDCSTGILMPLYDADTNMLFLAGKGDTTINYMEVTDKEPFLIEGLRHTGEQTKGACLVPKRALRVMEGEVNRVLQLVSNSVIPIMYQVPRKSYRDFHGDLYPETNGYKTDLTASEWVSGVNRQLSKMSLDPAKRDLGDQPIIPRLGPKPFSNSGSSGDFSFDKVFSVPQAPSSENGENSPPKSEMSVEEVSDEKVEVSLEGEDVTLRNGKDESPELPPRTPSTAERRKLFELNKKESEDSDTVDEKDNFERFSSSRNSIAERRRLYENRSQSVQEEKAASPQPLRRRDSLKSRREKEDDNKKVTAPENTNKQNSVTVQAPKRTSTVFGRVSKFRHLKGTPGHRSTNIENIRNVGRQLPGECDGFHANFERVAIPLSGQGGKIAVFELSKPGRLPDGVIPSLVNGNNIMDFQFDPFDPKRLVVACDDGIVKIWNIAEGGLTEPINTPTSEFAAHGDKIYFARFHPLAENVLLTASYDMNMKLWDLNTKSESICLTGHTDQIFAFSWSPCGKYGATVSKDGKIRVYDPRKSSDPIREGNGPVGSRGARIVWAIDGNYIVVTGFDKVSERQIMVFKATDLSSPLNTIGLDVSPAILVPFYDEDSSTLFVTGKGDSTIYAFEITDESPYICPLSHHKCATAHQGLSFLTKNHCDVSAVEFAKALRLTNNTVEHLSFAVPRIKSELFQDDIFPPTRVIWTATMTASEWFAGKDKPAKFISLQPEGMECLSAQNSITSSAPIALSKKIEETQQHIIHSQNRLGYTNDGFIKSKQEQIQKSVSDRLEENYNLEQDTMEGVDENEWSE